MSDELSARIEEHFSGLTDPRRRKVTYPLINIVTIALCAVIAGADDFVTIAAWGRQKRALLARFLDMASGIPSHDRFNAVFKAIKPDQFERCLLSWVTSLHEVTAGQLIAIDGKPLRQSFDKADAKSAIHMVSAWATANHISLGQVVVDEKSNEITAITKMLDLLDVSGCLVTIDAMGCQAEIAGKIVEGKADYVLAVKGNQPTLHAGIVRFFLDHMEDDFARVKVSRHETRECGHGRDEHRTYLVCDVPEDLPDRARWVGLKRIGVAIGETVRGGKSCDDVRYTGSTIFLRALLRPSHAEAMMGPDPKGPDMHVADHLTTDQLRALADAASGKRRFLRIRAVLLAAEGRTAPEVAAALGCSRRAAQAWVARYNDEGEAAFDERPRTGRPPFLDDEAAGRLRARLDAGPVAEDAACTLRGPEVRALLQREFGVTYSLPAVYALLHRLGYSCLDPRPRHRKADPEAQEDFKKKSPAASTRSPASTPASGSRSGSRTRRGSGRRGR